MGVFDKLKNALFEEEYVEVEEKPKVKPKKERKRKEKKEKLHDDGPIAKKVVLPEKKEEPEEIDPVVEKPLDEDFDVEPLTHHGEQNYNFPIIDDSEFDGKEETVEETNDEPEIIRVVDPVEEEHSYERTNERHLYGIDEANQVNVMHYGSYEPEKKMFRPSPIISPIYGVLDKNYKKEEIVNKTEVRLTSSYAKENLSVDDVRNKAYGASKEEKPKHISKEEIVEEPEEENDDSLVDLSSDNDKPEVKEVTVGDAEEYFNDLGLEYNNDYKDASKEKATGRRSTKKKEEKVEEPVEENKEVEIPEVKEESKEDSDDNLFDLIDSMYEEENNE